MKDYKEKTELEKRLEAESAAEEQGQNEDEETLDAPEVELVADDPESKEAAAEGEDYNEEGERQVDGAAAALAEECEQLKNQLLRTRAEFDNYRKRTARENEQIRKTATESLIRDLMPAVDNLERALEHSNDAADPLAQGVEMVLRQIQAVLQAKGVEPIPAVGETFDPNIHEALANQPSAEHDEGVICLEYERGYRIGDYIVRPSKVVVSSGPPPEAGDDAPNQPAAGA